MGIRLHSSHEQSDTMSDCSTLCSVGDVIMANKKPVVNALENAGVVVQLVEAPKAEFFNFRHG